MKKAFLIIILVMIVSAVLAEQASAATVIKPPNNNGLVGWWMLDEKGGSILVDVSASANHASTTGSPSWVSGKKGAALQTNGSSQWGGSLTSTGLPTGTSAVSAFGWVKTTSTSRQTFFSYGSASTGQTLSMNISQLAANGRFIPDFFSAYADTSSPAVNDGQWHHVGFTFAGNTTSIIVYIDGIAYAGTLLATPNIASGASLQIGRWVTQGANDNNPYLFTGSIDDIRVYNRVLTAIEAGDLFRSGQVTRKTVSNSGLVGWWTFDEATSTLAHDFSGQGNTGTLVSAPTWSAGKKAKSLLFNGTTDYVTLGSGSTALANLANNFTMTAWVKTPTPTSRMTIFSTGYSCCAPMFGTSANTAGGLEVYYPGVYVAYSAASLLQADTWQHVAYTRNGTGDNHMFYINGVAYGAVGGSTASDFAGSSGTLAIGHRADCCMWNGQLDDVRVYNRTLSAAEIAKLYSESATVVGRSQENTVSNGLVGYWSFNGRDIDWSAGKAWDRSGNNYHGTMNNMSNVISQAAGKVGQGMFLDGSNDYIEIGTGPSAIANGNFSLCTWFKTIDTEEDILSNGVGTNGHWLIMSFQGKFRGHVWYSGNSNTIDSNATVNDGKWHHGCQVVDDTNITLYIDGAFDKTAALSGSKTSTSASVAIGHRGPGSGNSSFRGTLDEVRIYNRALSVSEIKQLYQLGR